MTRDEAAKIVETEMALTTNAAAQLVCGLVALGVLKLDEPKTARDLLKDRLAAEYGYGYAGQTILNIERALDESGLLIVEKAQHHDFTLACQCGWTGLQSTLINVDRLVRRCPKCRAGFPDVFGP